VAFFFGPHRKYVWTVGHRSCCRSSNSNLNKKQCFLKEQWGHKATQLEAENIFRGLNIPDASYLKQRASVTNDIISQKNIGEADEQRIKQQSVYNKVKNRSLNTWGLGWLISSSRFYNHRVEPTAYCNSLCVAVFQSLICRPKKFSNNQSTWKAGNAYNFNNYSTSYCQNLSKFVNAT